MLEKTINNSPGRLALPSVSSGLEAGSIFSLETILVAGILISIMAKNFCNSETSVLPEVLTWAPNDGFLPN